MQTLVPAVPLVDKLSYYYTGGNASLPPLDATAAMTSTSNNSGMMTPPDEDVVCAATTSGSIIGSTTPPAYAEVVASDKATARAIFFIGISNKRQIRAGMRDQIILKKTTNERHHTFAPPILITKPSLQNRIALLGQTKTSASVRKG